MLKISHLSFPGLGIDEFSVNSVAFTLFGKDVAWYGVIITTGIILAALYVLYRAKQEHVSSDDVLDVGIYTVLFAVLGARIFFVVTSLDQYIGRPFWKIFAIWEGGLAIYGAIIAGAITILVWCKLKKRDPLVFYDMIAPAVMIGQLMGRWGNFFNAEAYGSKTDIFCRMGILQGGEWYYYHPCFFYESFWNFIGLILISLFYKKKKYNGQIVLMYFAWYGFGRMFIEQLRTDSLAIGGNNENAVWYLKVSSILGLFFFLVCGGILLYNLIKKTKRPTAFDEIPEKAE